MIPHACVQALAVPLYHLSPRPRCAHFHMRTPTGSHSYGEDGTPQVLMGKKPKSHFPTFLCLSSPHGSKVPLPVQLPRRSRPSGCPAGHPGFLWVHGESMKQKVFLQLYSSLQSAAAASCLHLPGCLGSVGLSLCDLIWWTRCLGPLLEGNK